MAINLTALNSYQDRTTVQTEIRNYPVGLIDASKQVSNGAMWASDSLKSYLKTIQNQSFEVPALKESPIVVLTQESYDIPNNFGSSETVTATKYTLFTGYRFSPDAFGGAGANMVDVDSYKRNMYNQIFQAMANKKAEIIQTFLESNKTQVLSVTGAPTGYSFNGTSDQLEISLAAQGDIMLSTLGTIAKQNKLYNNYYFATTHGMEHAVNQYLKYGAGNDKNLQNQPTPNVFYDFNITNGSDRFTAYQIMNGAYLMVENSLAQFREGRTLGEAVFGLTDSPVPYLNEQIMVYQNRMLANINSDYSVTEGNMSEMFEEAFISKFFLLSKYNSDRASRVGDVIKIKGLIS